VLQRRQPDQTRRRPAKATGDTRPDDVAADAADSATEDGRYCIGAGVNIEYPPSEIGHEADQALVVIRPCNDDLGGHRPAAFRLKRRGGRRARYIDDEVAALIWGERDGIVCNPDDLADRFDRPIASLRVSSGEGRARIRRARTQRARIGLAAYAHAVA
jgi:hypothetical protein